MVKILYYLPVQPYKLVNSPSVKNHPIWDNLSVSSHVLQITHIDSVVFNNVFF